MKFFVANEEIFPDEIRKVSNDFDLNSDFDGWVSNDGQGGLKNAPKGIGWACFKNLNFNSDTAFQIALILNYDSRKSTISLYSRVKASNNWQDWTKNF